MSSIINQNYSQFYKGTEPLKSYGSNTAGKKDKLVRYEFNTHDEQGNKIMDKMSREETLQTMKEIRSQYGDDVIVEFSGDGMAALVEGKNSGDLDAIMQKRMAQRVIPDDMVTQLESTYQKAETAIAEYAEKVTGVQDKVSFYGASVSKEQSEKLQDAIVQIEEQSNDWSGGSWEFDRYAQMGLKVSELEYTCKEMGLSDDVTDCITGTYKAQIQEKLSKQLDMLDTLKEVGRKVMNEYYDMLKEKNPELYAKYKQRAEARGKQPHTIDLHKEAARELFDVFSGLDTSSRDNFKSSFQQALSGFGSVFLGGMEDVWKPQQDALRQKFMNFIE